jgi:hypothetical protein
MNLSKIPQPEPDDIPWSECPPEAPPSVNTKLTSDGYYRAWCTKNGIEPVEDRMIVKATMVKKAFHPDED